MRNITYSAQTKQALIGFWLPVYNLTCSWSQFGWPFWNCTEINHWPAVISTLEWVWQWRLHAGTWPVLLGVPQGGAPAAWKPCELDGIYIKDSLWTECQSSLWCGLALQSHYCGGNYMTSCLDSFPPRMAEVRESRRRGILRRSKYKYRYMYVCTISYWLAGMYAIVANHELSLHRLASK